MKNCEPKRLMEETILCWFRLRMKMINYYRPIRDLKLLFQTRKESDKTMTITYFLLTIVAPGGRVVKIARFLKKKYFLGNFSLRIFRFFIINKLIRFCISFKNASHQNDKTHRLIFDKLNLNVYIFNFFVKIAWRTSVLYCRNGRPSKPPSRNLKHYRRRCRRQ